MEQEEIKIVKKPWGEEIWFANSDKYAGKLLKIAKGHRFSLQYHSKKEETQYLIKGKAIVTFGTEKEHLNKTVLNVGDKFHVPAGMIHRVEAIEDCEVVEVSTPDLNDIIKIEDDYGRTGSGNNFENDENLHIKHIR
jgi:quercetin dioxygenase-like cupin family protein